MNRNKIFMCLAFVLLAGCSLLFPKGGKSAETHRYVLDYKPIPSEARLTKGPWPVKVRVRDFSITEAYRQNEIVYRQTENELGFYELELWAIKPEYLITDMAFRHLRAVKLFERVSRSVESNDINYILRGEVSALEEVDKDSLWYAHLALSLQLLDNQTQKVLWARDWDVKDQVLDHQPVYVVQRLSGILETIMGEAVVSLDSIMTILHTPMISPDSNDTTPDILATPVQLPAAHLP